MILVTGATGFVGSRVVHALRGRGHPVTCLVRDPARAGALSAWGCTMVRGDVTDPGSLGRALGGCDVVVHLVAIISGRPEDFEAVMTRGTEAVVDAAEQAGARRIVLMSSLGTGTAGSDAVPYYRAKLAMEQAVVDSGLEHVILRPSFVLGPTGGVLPRFLRIARYAPAIPVIGTGTQRIQPLWVEDLAEATAKATEIPAVAGRTFELGGPDVVDWNELWRRIARAVGRRPTLVHVSPRLVRPAARLAELLPSPPITRDQLAMLALGDNVCDPAPAVATFGIELTPLDEQLRLAVR